MYLEYHYVIAVILLSALIAGLLVRWRYKKQIKEYSGLVSHLRQEKIGLERIVDIGASDFKEQAAVLEKAQEYNAHYKDVLATVTQERDNGVRKNEEQRDELQAAKKEIRQT